LLSSTYANEKSALLIEDNGAYTEAGSTGGIPVGIPPGIPSIDKSSEDKVSEDKCSKEKNKAPDVFKKFAGDDPELLKTLQDFEKMRKERKKPMTDRAKTTLVNKLATFPREQWIPILEQSIFHDWLGIFPLKQDYQANQTSAGDTDNVFLRMMKEGT
jgi:hypothetical protein